MEQLKEIVKMELSVDFDSVARKDSNVEDDEVETELQEEQREASVVRSQTADVLNVQEAARILTDLLCMREI